MVKKFGQRVDGKWIRFHQIQDVDPPTEGSISNGIANTMITRNEKVVKQKSSRAATPKRPADKIPIKLPSKIHHKVDESRNITERKILGDDVNSDYKPWEPTEKVSYEDLVKLRKLAELERKHRNPVPRRQRMNTGRRKVVTKKKVAVVKRRIVRRRM